MEGFIQSSKIVLLLSFFSIYCGIFVWLYMGKDRKRIEKLRELPFRED